MTPPSVIEELAALGRAFGAPHWAQGPGGNVSIKNDGVLYVKASGTRLATVSDASGHVGVPLDDAQRAAKGDAEADARVFACKPRPSLETYFHAAGPRVVAHTHAVSALLAACSLRDLDIGVHARVPYERPGLGLATAIAERADGSCALLLESHGLYVQADTVDDAIAKSRAVDARCLEAFPHVSSFDEFLARHLAHPIEAVKGGFVRRLPARTGAARYLFPDAVVYASIVMGDRGAAEGVLAELPRPVILVGRERWAVARTEASLGSCIEVLAAHDWVADTLGDSARWLDDEEPARILGLPSEQYRMTLAR